MTSPRLPARARRVAPVLTMALLVLAVGVATSAVTFAVSSDASDEVAVQAAGTAPIQPAVLAVRDARRAYVDEVRSQHVAERAATSQVETTGAALDRLAERTAEKPEPPPPPAPAVPAGSVWDRLAACESGGNWAARHGLYEGGLQFHPSTWDRNRDADMPGAAYEASREQQIVVGKRVQARQGWSAWPACAARLGLT